MVRMAGSLNELNSLTDPTGDFLVSVVWRISGKSAKRIKGTESSAPTNTEPTASRAPRKERRFWREGSALADFFVTSSEFSSYISTPPHNVHKNSCAPTISQGPSHFSIIFLAMHG